jgi:hypothetical protein
MISIEQLYEGRNGRALAFALYAVCAVFLISPALDLLGSVMPLKPGNIQWRFGLMVSIAPTIMTGVISLAMFSVLGVLFGHAGVLRGVGIVALVLAVMYLGMLGVFGLDLLQLRKAVPADRQVPFLTMTAKCMLQMLIGASSLALLSVGSWRVTRQKSGAASGEGGSRRAPMVLSSRPSTDVATVREGGA